MSDSVEHERLPDPPLPAPETATVDKLDWHEVVYNEQFSDPFIYDRVPNNRGLRYCVLFMRSSALPMLVTAIALATAVVTFVSLVARPFPWSSQPVFGGGSSNRVATPPTTSPADKNLPLRPPAPGSAGTSGTPGVAASPLSGGSAAAASSGASGSPRPTSVATPTPGPGAITVAVPSLGLPIPLPPLTISVPPLSVPPVPLSLPVPLPSLPLPTLSVPPLPGVIVALP